MTRGGGAGWPMLRRVFRLPSTPDRLRAEVDEELRFHIEERVAELMQREGLSREGAEREARRRFGDVREYREQTRYIDEAINHRRARMELRDTLLRETRQAARSLRRAPAFTLLTVLALGLGLGATTTIFTLLDRVVLRPLPYATADRLLHIGTLWPFVKKDAEFGISRAQFFYFQKNSQTLDDIGLYDTDMLVVPGDDGAPAERVPSLATSASLFHVLGIAPEYGRLYTPEESVIPWGHNPAVALIGHDYWMRRFGGDRSIVGKRLNLGSFSVQIIGILPATARLPGLSADIWYPNHLIPSEAPQNNHTHKAIALMRPGETPQQATAELRALERRFEQENPRIYTPGFIKAGFALNVLPLRDHVLGPTITRALWILFASVGLVLLIAAANVANLFFVRIDGRRRETSLRTALGADRARLTVHFTVESMLVALGGAVLAMLLCVILLKVVVHFAPIDLPRLGEVGIGWPTVVFCVGVALAVGLLFGTMPLATRTLDIEQLRGAARGLTASSRRVSARNILVVAQVALSVVLLAGAGLMLKSFDHLRSVRPGFDPRGVLTMSVFLRQDVYYDREKRNELRAVPFWHEVTRRIGALPGVTGVGGIDILPLTSDAGCTGITGTGGPPQDSLRGACVPTVIAMPGYFKALGIQVRGRAPDWSDAEGASGSMVVSRALAERLWPGMNPIGKDVIYSPQRTLRFHVVGVADDVLGNGLQAPAAQYAYFPITAPDTLHTPMGILFLNLVIRSRGVGVGELASAVERIVHDVDPQAPVTDVEPMESIVARSIAQTTFTMMLLAIAAGIALVLSAVGIYGVISYVVSQRRSEIGIRMALGAREAQVGGMVVRESVWLALVGIAIGLVAAFAGTRLLRALLFDVSPTDPFVLAVAPVVLIAVAALASLAPARRAARVDPAVALRYD